MTVKLLTEHHLDFLHLKGGCTGSSESTLVKMPHCWKSHAMAQLLHPLRVQCNYLYRNKAASTIKAISMIPPMTPPAMAPPGAPAKM